ncbi:MAG: hypothetical protein R2854_20890 [Caldilineaceae bacterium]
MPTATPTEYAATDADAHAESDGDHATTNTNTPEPTATATPQLGAAGIDPLDGAVTGVNTVSGRHAWGLLSRSPSTAAW